MGSLVTEWKNGRKWLDNSNVDNPQQSPYEEREVRPLQVVCKCSGCSSSIVNTLHPCGDDQVGTRVIARIHLPPMIHPARTGYRRSMPNWLHFNFLMPRNKTYTTALEHLSPVTHQQHERITEDHRIKLISTTNTLFQDVRPTHRPLT